MWKNILLIMIHSLNILNQHCWILIEHPFSYIYLIFNFACLYIKHPGRVFTKFPKERDNIQIFQKWSAKNPSTILQPLIPKLIIFISHFSSVLRQKHLSTKHCKTTPKRTKLPHHCSKRQCNQSERKLFGSLNPFACLLE